MMELRPWHRHDDYNVPVAIRYPCLPVHELLGIPANAFPHNDIRLADIETSEKGTPLG